MSDSRWLDFLLTFGLMLGCVLAALTIGGVPLLAVYLAGLPWWAGAAASAVTMIAALAFFESG